MVNLLLQAYESGNVSKVVEILEESAFAASDRQDIEEFFKCYQQLRPLYILHTGSTNRSTLVALHLVSLLAETKRGDFHTELESLPESILDSKEVQWVRRVEQGLMEGSYEEVRELLNAPPSRSFGLWCDRLNKSVRSEIAECSESAYASLPINSLKTLLMLKNTKEAQLFAGDAGWEVENGRIIFPSKDAVPSSATGSGMQIDGDGDGSLESVRETLISQTLGYARELESIV